MIRWRTEGTEQCWRPPPLALSKLKYFQGTLYKPIIQSARLWCSPCTLWSWDWGDMLGQAGSQASHSWRKSIKETQWPLFSANTQRFGVLCPNYNKWYRELLQKGTKVNPSQISLKWERKMPALGAFKAWKRSFLGYSLLPQVFSQKTLLSRL